MAGSFHGACAEGPLVLSHISVLCSFFIVKSYSISGYGAFYLSTHQLRDISVVPALAVMNNAGVNVYKFCVDIMFSFGGVYLGVESLGHIVSLCRTF